MPAPDGIDACRSLAIGRLGSRAWGGSRRCRSRSRGMRTDPSDPWVQVLDALSLGGTRVDAVKVARLEWGTFIQRLASDAGFLEDVEDAEEQARDGRGLARLRRDMTILANHLGDR